MILVGISLASMVKAQQAGIQGNVIDERGNHLPFTLVSLNGTGKAAVTDTTGRYRIQNISPGRYLVGITRIGYKPQENSVELLPGQVQQLDFIMEEDVTQLEQVEVTAKSESEELKETGYAVEVVEVKERKNLTSDINQVLKSTAGIHIRETGGVGSGFRLSLNGLSGNQIRYFIDGVPMENFGSALTLNNYPVNLIEKIEVYKGVVPVSLGADALGGAINITTGYRRKSFLDVAYSHGSFNTHQASVNGRYVDQERGYFVKLSSFFNHSDNNYRMENMPVFDLELGNRLGTIDTRRFHNEYTSGMVQVEAGLLDKKMADRWSLALTTAGNRKNYQHPDNTINRAFGAFHTKNRTLLASSTYRKYFKNLELRGYALMGRIMESVVDTSSKKYNWVGDYIIRKADDPKGELFERRSLMELTDFVLRSNLNADYQLGNNHALSVNLTPNYLRRTGEDQVDEFNRSFETPNYIHKNLLGMAYTFKNEPGNVEATAFAKQYWFSGNIITQDYQDNDITTRPGFNSTGYGSVFTWHVTKAFQTKSSFERTFRIPESYEILGDGVYIRPNPTLAPETSYNANLGMRYIKQSGKIGLTLEANYFYRFSKDFILFNPIGPFGTFENLSNVRTIGTEGGVDVNYNEFVMLNANFTWQNLTDQTEFDEGLPNINYKSRVPNTPYLFGNVRLGINPMKGTAGNNVVIYWNTRYVHEFFFTWENLGDADGKSTIPRQLTHDLHLEYAMDEGRYNLSLSLINITDALVFDNFNIQRPGRAIYVKCRYFLN